MGILSGESFLDQVVDGAARARSAHPGPENLEFRGFVVNEDTDPQGWKGVHSVGQTPDGQWWSTNHLTGAQYQIEVPESLHGPEKIVRCVMHNFHLADHIPTECVRTSMWDTPVNGKFPTMGDLLLRGYHRLRQLTCRAIVDLHIADNEVEWLSRDVANGGQLEKAKANYEKAKQAFEKVLAELRANKHNTTDLSMPEITREALRNLASRIRKDGIPVTNHRDWEWPDHPPCNAIITGYCPECGERCITIRLDGVEVHSFAPTEGWNGSDLRKGQRFGGRYTSVKVDDSPVARPWQPTGLLHIRSYDWYEKLGAPGITAQQTEANASVWTEYDLLPPRTGSSKWVPEDRPPRCKYCEFFIGYTAHGLI